MTGVLTPMKLKILYEKLGIDLSKLFSTKEVLDLNKTLGKGVRSVLNENLFQFGKLECRPRLYRKPIYRVIHNDLDLELAFSNFKCLNRTAMYEIGIVPSAIDTKIQ